MFWHDLGSLSAVATMGGALCLAALLASPAKLLASRRDLHGEKVNLSFLRRLVSLSGTVALLASVLLLPAGSLPGYVNSSMIMGYWFTLFTFACVALAAVIPLSRIQVMSLLGTPVLLAIAYAICARYAYLHGFPGNLWQMETFVAMPLLGNATPLALAGVVCLGAAVVLQCASALRMGERAFFLRACLRLAAAQFVIGLFTPVLVSRYITLPPVVAVTVDYALYWLLVALLLSVLFPLAARLGGHRWLAPVLVFAGALLCLL